jgi:hypothetical protein
MAKFLIMAFYMAGAVANILCMFEFSGWVAHFMFGSCAGLCLASVCIVFHDWYEQYQFNNTRR